MLYQIDLIELTWEVSHNDIFYFTVFLSLKQAGQHKAFCIANL